MSPKPNVFIEPIPRVKTLGYISFEYKIEKSFASLLLCVFSSTS